MISADDVARIPSDVLRKLCDELRDAVDSAEKEYANASKTYVHTGVEQHRAVALAAKGRSECYKKVLSMLDCGGEYEDKRRAKRTW